MEAGGGTQSAAQSAKAATPIAQRAAAALGVNLAGVAGSARGGRVTKDDVLTAAANVVELPEGATKIKGGAAVLARYMDESRSIPTATSFRTLAVGTLDARRKQLKDSGQKVSFTHLIAYAIAKAATDEMPVMAHHFVQSDGVPYRVDDGGVNLGLAVDVEKKDGSRTLMVPVIRDAGRLDFRQFLDAYNALVEKARTNTLSADDLSGANISLTNPGGIGTVASVPRLMVGQGTIVATGIDLLPGRARGDRRADRRREGHDDDVDLRSPDHPGRRVRPLPEGDRGVPPGRTRLLRVRLQLARREPGGAAGPSGTGCRCDDDYAGCCGDTG